MTTGSVLAQFTITLSQAVSEQVAVEWHTEDGTAQAGVDYAPAKGTVLFAPGETSKVVDILVYGRAVGSEDRSFFVEMLPPVNAILGASIGECIIHVDTTGSTPVTQIIVPTGPQGLQGDSAYQTWLDLGNTGTEQDFLDSLKPSPEEIAEEVAPLLDMGESPVTADGTAALSKPDTMKLKALARRVAYVGATKVATVTLADGDNLIGQSDLVGDVVDMGGIGLYPRIMRGDLVVSPKWSVQVDGRLLIKDAVAGDVLYVCQYDFVSDHAATNLSRESLRRSYEEAGYHLVDGSFEEGGEVSGPNDVLLHHGSSIAFAWGGVFPKSVSEKSTPASSGGISPSAWIQKSGSSLRLELSSYAQIAFSSVSAMQSGTTPGGVVVALKAGDECFTGATRWRIGTNAAGVPVGSGLYAEPLTSICFDDWGFTSAVSLAADLNAITTMAGAFGIGRVYSKGGKTYYTEDTINLSGLNIDLDFGWSVLIDNVQGFRADLSGRAKPTFIQYNSIGSKVRCVNHMVHPDRAQSAGGNGADVHYWMGGQQMGAAFTVGPLVEDIVLQDTKRGCMPVAVTGNIKNWNVRRFDVYGDASWGIDVEWGWQGTEGSKTGIPEDPIVNQTMENGQIPYNGHVENFNGYELQNCKGFLRTAGCYNTKFENCVGYNVDNFIYVYGGDKNPSVFTQNDRFKGCKLKINRATFTKPTYCITVVFPNNDGTLGDALPSWTDYDHTVVFDDCEVQGNYASGAFQTAGLRFYGCNGAVEFNRCTLKNCYYGARLEKAVSNSNYTSRFSLEFNNCIFKRNYQDASLNSIDGVNFNHCKFRSMIGTALPSVGVGLASASNYNKFIDCSWSGQNDRSGGVQAFIQLGSGTGNHLVRCRFEPFLSAYRPVEQTGSGVFNGYGNSSPGELTLSTNAAKKIIGESSTITKTTSGLSGSQLDFNIGEVWITNSAMTINQCINGKSGDRLVIRGATSAAFTIQHNAVAGGTGRFINLTNASYSHSSDNWAHTYVNSGGDWYEI